MLTSLLFDMKRWATVLTIITTAILAFLPCSCRKQDTAVETPVLDLPSQIEAESEGSYPSRPIKMIVAYKEGGGTDIAAKLICAAADDYMPEPFVIENIVGTDGELGYTELCSAKPDGYTIGFINIPTFLSITMSRSTLYSVDGIEPIANIVYDPGVLAVRSDSPIMDFQGFIEAAKSSPGIIRVGNNGYGASDHLMAAEIAKRTGLDLAHVPFPGTTDMLEELESGHIDAVAAKVSEVASLEKEGKVRILCLFAEKRFSDFPDVPTARELGYDIVFGSARAVAAPDGTPREIISYLADIFRTAVEDPEVAEKAAAQSIPLEYMGPDELSALIDDMLLYRESWAKLINEH